MEEVREPHASEKNVPGRRNRPCKGPGLGELPGIFHDNTEAVWLFRVPNERGVSDMVLGGQLSLCVGVRAQAVTIPQG